MIDTVKKILNEHKSHIETDDWISEKVIDICYKGQYVCSVSHDRVFNKKEENDEMTMMLNSFL